MLRWEAQGGWVWDVGLELVSFPTYGVQLKLVLTYYRLEIWEFGKEGDGYWNRDMVVNLDQYGI
jgi:hypothetical protein